MRFPIWTKQLKVLCILKKKYNLQIKHPKYIYVWAYVEREVGMGRIYVYGRNSEKD